MVQHHKASLRNEKIQDTGAACSLIPLKIRILYPFLYLLLWVRRNGISLNELPQFCILQQTKQYHMSKKSNNITLITNLTCFIVTTLI